MTRLSTDERKHLQDADFAYVDKDGERHLPIHDAEHVRNAIQRFGRTDFESREAKQKAARKIIRAARRHGIEIGGDDDVSRAAD